MATSSSATSEPTAQQLAAKRRPNPRIAQLRRTLYFLTRNTLAIVGIGILVLFICIAIYGAFFDPGQSSTLMNSYCGTYLGNGAQSNNSLGCTLICTYPTGSPPPQPNCYPTDYYNPSIVGPTIDFAKLSGGPLPLGSLTLLPSGSQFFNIEQGFVKGAQWTLMIASVIVVSGALIGLMLGAIAGYRGGYTDEVIMRFTDIFLSIPGLLLVLVTLAVVGADFPSLWGRMGILMGAFIVTWWPIYTRIVRGQVLVTREQKYVEASRASGAKTGRIIARHIIPNSMYPVFVQMSLDVGSIPLAIAGIVFLGFQIFPSQYFPEWGSMAANSVGVEVIQGFILYCQGATSCIFPWWQVLIPGGIIFLFAISVNFVSDGLRDALDPRLRR